MHHKSLLPPSLFPMNGGMLSKRIFKVFLPSGFVFVKKVEDTNIKAKPKKKGDSITQMMMKAQLRKTDDEDDEKEKARIYRKPGCRTSNFF